MKRVIFSALLCVMSQLLDIFSSLGMGPQFEETNVFSRYPDHSFWLSHALVTKSVWMFMAAIMSSILYGSMLWLKNAEREELRELPTIIATFPWLYFAFLALDAAASNVLLRLGYSVP